MKFDDCTACHGAGVIGTPGAQCPVCKMRSKMEDVAVHRNVTIDYTNWRGERGMRVISPGPVYFGSNEWHPEPQWLMRAYDVEKQAHRTFAMAGIHAWIDPPSNDMVSGGGTPSA